MSLDKQTRAWRKSSRSGGSGAQCVELSYEASATSAVRDSKNPNGPVLSFATQQVAAFIERVRSGQLDR
jgi:hypothetical protein